MELGIVSDIHLRENEHDEVCQQLEQVVTRFNQELQPDGVVFLGDFVEETSPEIDRRHLEEIQDIIANIESPTYVTAGNHDIRELSAEEVADVFNQRLNQVIKTHDQDLIILNTASPHFDGTQGRLTNGQKQFLKRSLDRSDDAIVCVHHPIHYHDISDNTWFSGQPERAFLINKHQIQNILRNSNAVRAVVNGHIHETDKTTVDNIPHFTVNAFNKEYPDSQAPTGTHSVLSIDENGISLQRFDVIDL